MFSLLLVVNVGKFAHAPLLCCVVVIMPLTRRVSLIVFAGSRKEEYDQFRMMKKMKENPQHGDKSFTSDGDVKMWF